MKIYKLIPLLICCLFFSCKDDDPLTTFDGITVDDIISFESQMTATEINSTIGERNEIPEDAILVFRTGDGNYGKMLFLNNSVEETFLEFRYDLFSPDKELILSSEFSAVQQTFLFDFETNSSENQTRDFWWEWNQFNNGGLDGEDKFLVPIGDCVFHIFI